MSRFGHITFFDLEIKILSGTLMTCPMPFHGGARSPLYLRQISSPCISRISERKTQISNHLLPDLKETLTDAI